jgi:hypothetical protein
MVAGAAAAVPLPLLDAMLNSNGTALAVGEPLSPLYVTWFFGNGTLPGRWKPATTGAGSAWDLSPQLAPLSALKSYLTVITGLENKLVVGGVEHPSGSAGATTGAPLDGNAVRAPSIDQLIADVIADGAPYRSIEVGVTPATPNGPQQSLHSVSHNGPNAMNSPEFDPRKVFERLFADTSDTGADESGSDQEAKMARVRTSVLDAVLETGTALQQRLGAADRQRIEQHLEAIRAIERRLDAMPADQTGAACAMPSAPTTGPDMASEGPPEVNTAMVELSSLALACERTRVLTYIFSLPAAHVYYRHLGADMNDDFHDTICHTDPGTDSDQPRVDRGVIYAMNCLEEFLSNLQSTPHGASTLLDASLVYVTSDTAWGQTHSRTEWPVLLAGKAGGRLRGDEHHNFPGESLSKALLTVAQIIDPSIAQLGLDAGLATSPLSGIIV